MDALTVNYSAQYFPLTKPVIRVN